MPRHKIVGHSPSPLPYSHSPTGATRHKETEISVNQKNIKQEVSQQDKDEESRTYSPIPISFSVQIGGVWRICAKTCWIPYSPYNSVWNSGTSACWVKICICICEQSGTWTVCSTYSSRCSGRRRIAPSLGYIFADR